MYITLRINVYFIFFFKKRIKNKKILIINTSRNLYNNVNKVFLNNEIKYCSKEYNCYSYEKLGKILNNNTNGVQKGFNTDNILI